MDIPASNRAGYPSDGSAERSALRPTARQTAQPVQSGPPATQDRRREPGLPGWLSLLILLAIAGIGGAIDIAARDAIRGGFNVGLILASVVAILVVRRRNMLTIVVAPPLVYAAASVLLLYIRSGGLSNRKVLLDAAVNWLVYGFPAMAAATAAVVVIAGIRLVRGRHATDRDRAVPPVQADGGYYPAGPGFAAPIADGEFGAPQRYRAGGQRS